MALHETGVHCPHNGCKGMIVVESGVVALVHESQIPMGPASGDYFATQLGPFYCNICQTLFHHPPGKPEIAEEILQKIHDEAKTRADEG